VLGAYLVLYPKARILTLIFPVIVPIPAIIFLGFWFLMQWFYAIFLGEGMIAYWAHIGGFIAGMILGITRWIAGSVRHEFFISISSDWDGYIIPF